MLKRELGKAYKYLTSIGGNIIYLFHKKTYDKILEAYHNKYLNQSCFVVGNGPSLSGVDLDELQKRKIITFAANKIYNIFDDTSWRPTFVSIDDDGYSKNQEVLSHLAEAGQKMTFTDSHYGSRLDIMKPKLCLVKTRWSRKYLKNPHFSLDVSKEIYSIATVTYFNFQLAYYMGFRKIYLLGVDNKYKLELQADGTVKENEGRSYFNENAEEGTQNIIVDTSETITAYEFALKTARQNGFEIVNLSRGGYLKIFPNEDFDEVMRNWNE